MKNHILLEKANSYEEKNIESQHKGYSFDDNRGFWVGADSNDVMMINERLSAPATKKCDRETGEDQKGE